jgi:hypothetical protein
MYTASIADRLETIAAIVEAINAAELNRRPAADSANSPWVLATHTAGSARAWVLGIACGQDVRRDRPAEFVSSGDDGARLAAELRRTAAEIGDALRSLAPGRLDTRLLPSQELWGESEPHEIDVRYALLHQVEHMSQHLGELQLTRHLVSRES